MTKLMIRPERADDYASILRLTYEAFLTLDFPGRRRMDEHYLLHLLRGTEFPIPGLSFAAELDGEIAGHILYTRSVVGQLPTVTFGPLSVLPKYHRQGIGRALVEYSMKKAREMGFGAVLITGVPDYYPKLGFSRGRAFGVTLPDGSSPDALMGYELIPGYLSGGGTLRFEAMPIFEQAEEDDDGCAAFHRGFMRAYQPGKLILRRFWDADIALMEHWLYLPHVAKWFKRPDHWLRELNGRWGDFAFLRQFIAEYEGLPIGFCQYYDTHFAQKHEIWNDEWRTPKRTGKVFGVDCLIGESEFLRRGLGREMIILLLREIRRTGAVAVIAQPEKENIASCRMLESAGLQFNGRAYVMNFQ